MAKRDLRKRVLKAIFEKKLRQLRLQKLSKCLTIAFSDQSPVKRGTNCCWNCNLKTDALCPNCKLARYCDEFCQFEDWQWHHEVCDRIRRTSSMSASSHQDSSCTTG